MKLSTLARYGPALLFAATCVVAPALAATPAELMAAYAKQAGSTPSPERGQRLYTTNFGKDFGWSCATCHGATPTKSGKDEVSDKVIGALAPAANPERFTDRVKVENRFRLNCKDVVGRECTAAEKADVISWLLTLKP